MNLEDISHQSADQKAMSATNTTQKPTTLLGMILWFLVGVGGLGGLVWVFLYGPMAPQKPLEETKKEEAPPAGLVTFPKERWEASGIQIGALSQKPFVKKVWRTGRLGPDETRIAHMSPVVDGIVREVRVRLGQPVKAGEVLAILDCREVGQAKLELVKVRLALDYAKAQYDRTVQSTANALAMVEAMLAGVPINQIEERFRDRSIGELRSQLMTAYARKFQAKAQYDIDLQSRGTISEAAIIKSRSDNDTAEAVYRALCEETKFQGQIQVRSLEQKLREAQTAQSLARAQLLMYGYTTAEVDSMDPIAEGAAVSLYPVRAPFSGTITEQHAVIAERIGPLVQMFQISDYSKLWMTADIYENDLPLVRGITGKKLRFRSSVGMALAEAEVFSVGGQVDTTTRTVSLRALVSNPSGDFKAGSFVDVELVQAGPQAITIPLEAIQRDGRQAFVFVVEGEETFRRVDVQLGAESEGEQVVESGLTPGMKIAIRGGFILKSELMKDLMAGE